MKLKQFQEFMKKEEIDLTLIYNYLEKTNPNFVYFTKTSQITGILLLNKNTTLFSSPLEISIAEERSQIKNIKKLDKNIFKNIKELKPKKIGIDKSFTNLNQFKNIKSKLKNIKFIDISPQIQKFRLIKTEEEISLIKKSCNFADLLINESINQIKKTKTELELKKFIEKKVIELNLEQSFTPIVASFVNSKNPHHISNNTKLKRFTVIDLGVKYKNYCSDITRTIFIGKPNKKDIEFYNKVLQTQEYCINKNLRPKKLHQYAQKSLGKFFTHSLGHGIGLEVHENPQISSLSKDKFDDNLVFTLEPGYYNKFGIRIEDVLFYKNNKKIPLTNSPKELTYLG